MVHRYRPYDIHDLGQRYRICFHGAEYRGRGRQTSWAGQVLIENPEIARLKAINAWNHDRLFLLQAAPNMVEFDRLTTGNFVGFDI